MTRLGVASLLLLVASCHPGPPPDPVIVYAADEWPGLEDVAVRYTRETGAPVTLRRAPSAVLAADVAAGRGDPPADVLIVSNVIDAWRVADAGALRPLEPASLRGFPDLLRDPEGYWAGLRVRFHAILNRDRTRPAVADYDTLADPAFVGRLCLSSARLETNLAWIAMLIEDRGTAGAERLLRLLLRNLAAPPFDNETALLEAVGSGRCDYAVATTASGQHGTAALVAEPRMLDVDAIGVARHATAPEAAQAFVAWMIGTFHAEPGDATAGLHPGIAGYRADEARSLAERVGYR